MGERYLSRSFFGSATYTTTNNFTRLRSFEFPLNSHVISTQLFATSQATTPAAFALYVGRDIQHPVFIAPPTELSEFYLNVVDGQSQGQPLFALREWPLEQALDFNQGESISLYAHYDGGGNSMRTYYAWTFEFLQEFRK